MHFYSVAFILALLAFGGIAAYLGDILGYRLGKRRLSLLRLRPRTTARLVGILAGILIPAVTVLVGYWQVDYVRIALVELDDLGREADQLRHERDTMEQQRDVLRHQRNSARDEARGATAEAKESKDELEQVATELDTAQGHLESARARVDRLRSESGRLRADKERAQEELKAAAESLKAAERDLEAAKLRLKSAEEDRTKLDGEVEELRQRYTTLKEQLDALEEEWKDRQSRAAGTLPIFDLGAELVRGVIQRPESLDALKNEVVALLVLADQAAEAEGAAIGDNDRYVRAVGPSPPDALEEGQEWPPESRVLGYFVGQLWDAVEDSQVVQVVVSRRAFLGEQVYVVFVKQPNRLVFRRGETIVAREIGPGLDEAEVFQRLWLLIADPSRSEVRKQAQAAGMLPDPTSGRYGEVRIRELFRATKECTGLKEAATVKVEAAEDTCTAGPLIIRIVVQPSAGGSQ